MPSFCCITIFMSSPRCHLLLRHDIFVFTTMPSFVAPRYFCFHRDAIFLLHHDTFLFATNFCRSQKLTPSSAAEGHRRSLRPAQMLKLPPHEIYATVLPSAGAGVRPNDFIIKNFLHQLITSLGSLRWLLSQHFVQTVLPCPFPIFSF